ncbi:MAG TPA: hypothetical protein GX706_03825 [Candidatus Moranbacteria bacterium]|nr:hypothetical protein [Candidatus Moranbacteria bacterium]
MSSTQPQFIMHWKADRFEDVDRHPRWHMIIFISLVVLLAYSLFSNNFLLAIIIILGGLLFYLFEKMPAKTFRFGITTEGVFAQDRIYEFSSLESFWIFYEPGKKGRKELSLKRKGNLLTHAHIPLGEVDPTKVRDILLRFLPEEEHQESFFDALERFF